MTKHVSFVDLLKAKQEKDQSKDPDYGRPVDQKPVDQTTRVVDQTTTEKLVDQETSRPGDQSTKISAEESATMLREGKYPSRKERQRIGLRLPAYKLEKYRMWCFVNKVDMQDAFETAMDWLTGRPVDQSLKLVDQTTGRPRIDHDHDDLIDDNLSSIMNFYAKWTGNKPTDKDKEAYKEVAHFDLKITQIGILMSIYRSKTKVGSFKYCIGAIQEAASAGLTDLDSYLQYVQKKVQQK